MPLTPNGKINRAALPSPKAVEEPSDSLPVRALSDTEERLLAIWTRLLDVTAVPLDADFFGARLRLRCADGWCAAEIGGHSILATRLVMQASRAFETVYVVCGAVPFVDPL